MACQYMRPVKVDVPIETSVVPMRRGRTNELLSVTLGQEGKVVTEAHVRAVDGGAGPEFEPIRRPTANDPYSWPTTLEADRADGYDTAKIFHQFESHDSRVRDQGLRRCRMVAARPRDYL